METVCSACGFDAKRIEPRPEKLEGAVRWHRAVCKGSPDRQFRAPERSAITGACLCTSFRWNTVSGDCMVCGHAAHGSRIHCGVL